MKTMILIPCMDMLHTAFVRSLLSLDTNGHDILYGFKAGSLVYDSRNKLLKMAKDANVDRLLWLDSDMDLPMNTLQRLSADIDAGCEIVTGVYHKRKAPFTPTIYKRCEIEHLPPNYMIPIADPYLDYPKDSLFNVEAFGFGCVLMTMEAANKITDQLGMMPFMPVGGFGEDLSFCMRARQCSIDLWCDSRVQCGHVGMYTYTEADYHGISKS